MLRTNGQDQIIDDAMASLAESAPVVRIVKSNAEKQIVYGVVYAPGEIDAHGETMLAEDVETMCHEFMRLVALNKGAVIDTEHDNVALSAFPVECYIEKEEGNDWPVGSWVMGVKIEDPGIWSDVKKGRLNGFSFEAMVRKLPVVVEVELEPDMVGKTAENEGHDHVFFMEFNEEGRVVGGTTSFDNGHRHKIRAGTATEMASAPGIKDHAHRLPV